MSIVEYIISANCKDFWFIYDDCSTSWKKGGCACMSNDIYIIIIYLKGERKTEVLFVSIVMSHK